MSNENTTESTSEETTQEINFNDTTYSFSEKTIVLSEKHFEKNISRAEKLAKEISQKHSFADTEVGKNFRDFFQLSNSSIVTTFFNDKSATKEVLEDEKSEKKHKAIYHISTEADNTHNIFEDFELVAKLAEGGQGFISSAVDKKLGRIIAIKSLHDNLKENDNARNNFITEAKITAQLDHPGIVSVYSLATDGNNGLHLAMKLINGDTLSERLFATIQKYRKYGIKSFDEKKDLRKRLEIIIKSCEAIAYAHNRNVMHCDLKPDNIMSGEYGETYIMDWGIAKLIKNVNNELLSTKATAGTPQYFSPEALHGKGIDHRSDIYTMGVILFETVYLKKAFTGNNEHEILKNVKNYNISSFKHAFKVSVSKDLKAIITKATAFDPADRYQSITEFIDDLRHFLNNEETTALPDSSLTKIFRWSSTHIKSLMLIILVCMLTTVILFFANIYNHIQNSKKMLQQEIALSNAYSKNLEVASLISQQMNYVEDSVNHLRTGLEFILNNKLTKSTNKGVKKNYFDIAQVAASSQFPAGTEFSKFYQQAINMQQLGYQNTANLMDDQIAPTLNVLNLFLPSIKQIIEKSTVITSEDTNQNNNLSKNQEQPAIFLLYFGFDNGLFVTYPGFMKPLENYSPTNRKWYIDATADNPDKHVVWGTPYTEMVTQKATISCSAPITVNNQIIGAVSADLTMSTIVNFLRKNGNPKLYTREKVLVNNDGDILFSTIINYDEKDTSEFFNQKFPSVRILNIIKNRKNGYYINQEKYGKFVYIFSYIPQLDWYYIEKINHDFLIDIIQKEAKTDGF